MVWFLDPLLILRPFSGQEWRETAVYLFDRWAGDSAHPCGIVQGAIWSFRHKDPASVLP